MEDSAQARITANTTTPSATTRPLHVKIVGLQNRPSYNGLTAAARPFANPNDGRPGFSVIIDGTFEKKWLKECYIEVIDATIDPKRDMPMRQGLVKVHDASCSCRACEHVHAAVGGQGAQGDGSLL